MATFTVTTAADVVASDGKLSLREAVAQTITTAEADTIRFAAALEGETLVLTRGQLTIIEDVTITGDRDGDGTEVALSGGDASRILNIIGSDTDVSLRDLTLTEARGPDDSVGGSIFLGGGSLRMTGCTLSDSHTYNSTTFSNVRGGGIYAAAGSNLSLNGSAIRNCGVTSFRDTAMETVVPSTPHMAVR